MTGGRTLDVHALRHTFSTLLSTFGTRAVQQRGRYPVGRSSREAAFDHRFDDERLHRPKLFSLTIAVSEPADWAMRDSNPNYAPQSTGGILGRGSDAARR